RARLLPSSNSHRPRVPTEFLAGNETFRVRRSLDSCPRRLALASIVEPQVFHLEI
ncbi:unnamed protein product, partial [Haemonchus placei]|uniref:MSP domain-containing protein n=1 Tax=Haemonchus placei TaxID=6290 RepID=A0A0N4VVR4_HAEPC